VDPFLVVSLGLVLAVLALVVTVRMFNDKVVSLREELRGVTASRAALASTHERVTAQWAPVLSGYPHDPRGFRFVGSPIDGVQFAEDRVVFVAFTSDGLTPTQERVRDLVRSGKVEWLEVYVGQPGASSEPASGDASFHAP
jgi:predicted Holliday junction resolvase-like endonuclease